METREEIMCALKNIIDDAHRDVLNTIHTTETNKAAAICIAFRYGVICGKRTERAKKK